MLDLEFKISIGIVAIFIMCLVGGIIIKNRNKETITITVKEKVVKNGHNSSKYLIFTDDEVFENDDNWLRLKFNSSDLQSRFEVGKSYEVVVVGKRIRLFSMYRNILEVKEWEI